MVSSRGCGPLGACGRFEKNTGKKTGEFPPSLCGVSRFLAAPNGKLGTCNLPN